MDTAAPSHFLGSEPDLGFASPETIEPSAYLHALQAGQSRPVLDVRKAPARAADPVQIVGAQWRDPLSVADWASEFAASLPANLGLPVVVYCVYGHGVGLGVARALRKRGIAAQALAGGLRGGEDGVDSDNDIARWRALPLPLEPLA